MAWKGLKASTRLSGGLTIVVIQANGKVNGNAVTARLMVNGAEKRRWIFATANIDTHSNCWVWFGNLGEGQTTFEIEAKVDTGTAELQDNIYGTATSSIHVLQYVKG